MLTRHIRIPTLLLLATALAACGGVPPVAVQPTVALPIATAARVTVEPLIAATATTLAQPDSPPTATQPVQPTNPVMLEPTAQPSPTSAGAAVVAGTLALPRGQVSQRLLAVMIDNHPRAYPQAGLDKAPLVFEALAEFGITRYMAVFAPGISPSSNAIGPVRSARAYFVEWAMGLDAVYAHAGGSPDGLLLAQTAIEIVNADALHKNAGQFFRRDASRPSPHNLFTSSDALAQAAASSSATVDWADMGYLFKADAPAAERPTSQSLSYFFIYREESAGWEYLPNSNAYARLRRGRPHLDAITGEQLVFKNVVMMEVQEAARQGDAKGRIDQNVIGEGRARLFLDGLEREVTWQKLAPFAPLRFFSADGAEVTFNAGPIWLAAIPSLDNLSVQ